MLTDLKNRAIRATDRRERAYAWQNYFDVAERVLTMSDIYRIGNNLFDNEKDTLQVEKLDNLSDIPRVNSFGIVGLEREAKLKGVSLDTYIAHITKLINSSNLDESLKTNITKEITPITYGENTVLMIPVKNGDEPVYLNDVLYERVGAQTCEVKGAKQKEIFKLFN